MRSLWEPKSFSFAVCSVQCGVKLLSHNSRGGTYGKILWKTLFGLHCLVVDLHAAPRHELDDRGAVLWVPRGRSTVTVAIAIKKINEL